VGLRRDVAERNGVPVLAVCGFSGSGKTTMLEAAIPMLVGRGLALAVVKHDAHGFEVDRPGKDSDRLFRAGATVALSGPEQQFERRHATAMLSLEETLARLGRDHDLVLVEGHKDIDLPKIWLGNAERTAAPESVTNIVRTLAWNSEAGSGEAGTGEAGKGDRLAAFTEYIDEWLPVAWNRRPLYGGLLVGGMSSRMGSPKQLVGFGGRTLGEIVGAALVAGLGDARMGEPGTVESRTVALGQGVLPEAVEHMRRLPDSPGFAGPGAGLIAAHRWAPEAAWIVAACDHPWLRHEHIEWLTRQRQPGRWAVIPRQADGHPCPTLALYEPQALEAMERRSRTDVRHNANLSALFDMPRTVVLEPPAELADGWKNVNTPEELRAEESRMEELRLEAERLAPSRTRVDE